jgi:hypothetical protein
MKLPPSADKWVVFCAGLLLGLLEFSLLLPPFRLVLAALMQAVAFFVVYVIWSHCWRLVARRTGQHVVRHLRIWTNTTFAALILTISFIPIPTHAIKIDLPKAVSLNF